MNVVILVGSVRKGHTYNASMQFAENLKVYGDIECEIIRLAEYDLGICKGCIQCFERGEEFCPHADDLKAVLDKMESADGIVFATPNYGFHVSGLMKLFIDRLSYNFHRPRYFGKCATSIVTQAFYKGQDIVNYFKFISNALGFKTVKGTCLIGLTPMTEKQKQKNQMQLKRLSHTFYSEMKNHTLKSPNLFEMMIFRIGRTRVKRMLNDTNRDYTYYEEKGWFESDFYYPVKCNILIKLWGRFCDWITVKTVKEIE